MKPKRIVIASEKEFDRMVHQNRRDFYKVISEAVGESGGHSVQGVEFVPTGAGIVPLEIKRVFKPAEGPFVIEFNRRIDLKRLKQSAEKMHKVDSLKLSSGTREIMPFYGPLRDRGARPDLLHIYSREKIDPVIIASQDRIELYDDLGKYAALLSKVRHLSPKDMD